MIITSTINWREQQTEASNFVIIVRILEYVSKTFIANIKNLGGEIEIGKRLKYYKDDSLGKLQSEKSSRIA